MSEAREINTMAELDSLLGDDNFGSDPAVDGDVTEPNQQDIEESEDSEELDVEETTNEDDVSEPGSDEEEDVEDNVNNDEEEEEDDSKKDIKTKPKDHHAFAAMRKQNKQLQETLDNIARGLGIDPKDDGALEKLAEAAYNGIAKREGKTKEEVIADSQAQRELEAYRKRDITQHTTRQFEKIKNELGADKNRLNDFANKLVSEGYNLLGQKEDWVGMYKNMYFDELVEERVNKAVEEALKRDEAANNKSGKSNKKRGKRDSGGKQTVSTKAELDKFLSTI